MGYQRLGKEKTKIVSYKVGKELDACWVNNGQNHDIWVFRTTEDQHGWINRKTGEWDMDKPGETIHFDTCPKDRS